MSGLPAALFVIDPQHEHIAVSEANKLAIPVVALTDTNCDPDKIHYLIPGNDDAIRSIKLVTAAIADAAVHGQSAPSRVHRSRRAPGRRRPAALQVEFARTCGRERAVPRSSQPLEP